MHDLEAVLAIQQLTARYNRASDEGDVETWLDCYTPDAVFRRSNADRSFVGHEQLRTLLLDNEVAARHVTTNFEITVHGDTAEQVCYLMFLDRRRAFAVNMFGTYHDSLVRVGGRWFFRERRLEVDAGPPG